MAAVPRPWRRLAVLFVTVLLAGCTTAGDDRDDAIGEVGSGSSSQGDGVSEGDDLFRGRLSAGDWWRYEVEGPNETWEVTAVYRDDLGYGTWTLDDLDTARTLAAHRVPWLGHEYRNGSWSGAFYDDLHSRKNVIAQQVLFRWLPGSDWRPADVDGAREYKGSVVSSVDRLDTIRYGGLVDMTTTIAAGEPWFRSLQIEDLDWNLTLAERGSGWSGTSWIVTQQNDFTSEQGGAQYIEFFTNDANVLLVEYVIDCPVPGIVHFRVGSTYAAVGQTEWYVERQYQCPNVVEDRAVVDEGRLPWGLAQWVVPTPYEQFTGHSRIIALYELAL